MIVIIIMLTDSAPQFPMCLVTRAPNCVRNSVTYWFPHKHGCAPRPLVSRLRHCRKKTRSSPISQVCKQGQRHCSSSQTKASESRALSSSLTGQDPNRFGQTSAEQGRLSRASWDVLCALLCRTHAPLDTTLLASPWYKWCVHCLHCVTSRACKRYKSRAASVLQICRKVTRQVCVYAQCAVISWPPDLGRAAKRCLVMISQHEWMFYNGAFFLFSPISLQLVSNIFISRANVSSEISLVCKYIFWV